MKTNTLIFIITVLIILITSVLFAQTVTKDVVYLKNGSIVKGSIIEIIPEKSVKIQTSDGSIFVFTMSEIEKISKETVQSSEPVNLFGGDQSMPSFSIFGGAAIPVGDFASDDIEKENSGFAKTGYTAGLQFVTSGPIGFLINASFAQNSFAVKKDMLYFNTSDREAGSWTSVMLLAGLKVGTTNTTGVNFFFAPVIGVDLIWTPNITGKISDECSVYIDYPYYYNGYVPITGGATIKSISGSAFAYGAISEVIVGGNITLGARFIASSKVKYELKEEGTFSGSNGIIAINNGSYSGTRKIEIGRLIICLYMGVAF